MAKQLLPHLKPSYLLHWLLILITLVSLLAFNGDKNGPKKPNGPLKRVPILALSNQARAIRSFDSDPIKFMLQADKQMVTPGEEVTITITAHYLNIHSALLFTTVGSNAFRLKLLFPDGFVQTGGDYTDYIGAELSAVKPTVSYTLKGYFSKPGNLHEFRLLRGSYQADANSLFIEKSRLTLHTTRVDPIALQPIGARTSAAVASGVGFIDGADCNTAGGWAADRGVLNTSVNLDFYIDGQYAGTALANQSRPDVGAFLGDNGYHGFTFTIPQQFRTGGSHSIEARFSGTSQGLNSGAKTFSCSGTTTTPTPTGTCAYTEGQYLFTFNTEVMYAHYYNGVLYAAYQDGSNFKPQHWLTATGLMTQSVANCFAENDPRTTTTATTPTSNGTGNGLLGNYFNNQSLSGSPALSRTDATINFTWNEGSSPFPGVSSTNMSVRWEGQVESPVSGACTFMTNNDDATNLWVNGQQLISDWPGGHGPILKQGTINLVAGQKYTIKLEFNQGNGGAQAQLLWSYPGQVQQIIPQSRLYSNGTTTTTTPTGNCAYTEGQYLFTFNTEQMYAHYYNGVLYAAYQDGSNFRPQHWLTATGLMTTSTASCFAENDPHTTGSGSGGGSAGGGIGDPTGGGGNGLLGNYFNNQSLSGSPALSRTEATVNFTWDGNASSPFPGVNASYMSARWEGQIEAPVSGACTFMTNNDDATNLWVNGQQLISDWPGGHGPILKQGTINLVAGQKYTIKLEFNQGNGGAQAQLLWSYPGQVQQIIPQSRLYSSGTTTTNPTSNCGTGSGLTGFYSNSKDLSGNLVAIRTEGPINFTWSDSPIPGLVNSDGFSIRWFGKVEAPVSGNYTFKTNNDDGTRVWVNSQLLIDDWNGHGPIWQQGSIYLTGGQKYDIVVDFFDDWAGAQAQLYWEYPGQGLQLVPKCRLYPNLTYQQSTQTYRSAEEPADPCPGEGAIERQRWGCATAYACNPSGRIFEIDLRECETDGSTGGEGGSPGSSPGGTPGSGPGSGPGGAPVGPSGGGGTPGGPAGPVRNPNLPRFTLPIGLSAEELSQRRFYDAMQTKGITFTADEKAYLNSYPTIRGEVWEYINQTGTKPTLLATSSPYDEGLDPIDLYGGVDPYTGPDPNVCNDCPIITDPTSGTGIYGIPPRSAYPEGAWGDLLYKIDRVLFINALFPGVGALRAPTTIFTARNFRSSLNVLRAKPNGLYDAHHILPQKFKSLFKNA